MNDKITAGLTIRERERRHQLSRLNTAEAALQANLHMHGLDATAREHLERALCHIREGYVALMEPGRGRNLHELVEDLDKVERLTETLSRRMRIVLS